MLRLAIMGDTGDPIAHPRICLYRGTIWMDTLQDFLLKIKVRKSHSTAQLTAHSGKDCSVVFL